MRKTGQSRQITKLRRIEGREEDRITVHGWRTELAQESRRRITNKIRETLKKHLTASDPELMRIAVRFEEKVYSRATSQMDYLRKISLKMLTLETRAPNQVTLPLNPPENSSNPLEEIASGV